MDSIQKKSKKVKLCFGGAPVVYTVLGLNALYPGGIPYQSAPMLPGVGVYFLEAATAADWELGCGGRSPPPEKSFNFLKPIQTNLGHIIVYNYIGIYTYKCTCFYRRR